MAMMIATTSLMVRTLPTARADTAPDQGTPATVSNDVMPTWQINGVVWSEVVVGNTVYATGSFTKARPPGVAQGGTGEIPAGNIFAFDVRTGNPIAGFNHTLNAQGLVVRASPDGTRVYVGGDFTTVDGVARNHIAAFDTASGTLIGSFAPSLSGQVRAIAATSGSVYAGGNFFSSGGVSRTRLAAFSPTNGALQSWAPTADDNKVWSMVMAPDNSRVIVAGSFTTLNHVAAYGMGALSASTGATLAWAANQTIRDGGVNGAIEGLSTDGTQIMGSGWAFGSGASFEGTWSANPYTGAINWLNDCHGDTYDTFPVGQVLYSVSHTHDCSAVGEFPDTKPRTHFQQALAWTTYATGTNTGPDSYGWNYSGIPDSTMLHWYPTLKIGTFTGQNQAGWAVAGNASYIVIGGEFPTVNGVSQQGLVRFAVSSLAPNKSGPVLSVSGNPSAVSLTPETARVTWGAGWDLDNRNLTYAVRRDSATWVYSTVRASKPWLLPSMGFVDRGLAPGSTHTYQVQVTDPFGNSKWTAMSSVTVTGGTQSTYSREVVSDGAADFWRLGETSGSAVYDWSNFTDATAASGVSRGATGAINGDGDKASTFNGSSSGYVATNSQVAAPAAFTLEAWVRTTSNQGGKVLGYGSSNTGVSGSYDRHIYLDNAGHIWFGVYPGTVRTLSSSGTYNDGNWHYVVASLSSAGMALYVDSVRVGLDSTTTSAEAFLGYWRIGGDNLSGWPSQPSSGFLNGSIDDVAIYPSALTQTQITQHYIDSGRTPPGAPPADGYGKAVYQANPSLYWRLGEGGGSTAKDTGQQGHPGVYSGGVTYGVAGAVAGTTDTAVTLNGSDGAVASSGTFNNPTVYSEELWFKTSTHSGGKLIGLGNKQTGHSTSYDRHVYMLNTGQLRFGVWTGQQNIIDSPSAYNDGLWHYVVATQGPSGMHLYVDGQLVGSNSQTGAQNFTGYWRVGGDTTWGGNSSDYFAGSIDEIEVYSSELSATDVANHYALGKGNTPKRAPSAH